MDFYPIVTFKQMIDNLEEPKSPKKPSQEAVDHSSHPQYTPAAQADLSDLHRETMENFLATYTPTSQTHGYETIIKQAIEGKENINPEEKGFHVLHNALCSNEISPELRQQFEETFDKAADGRFKYPYTNPDKHPVFKELAQSRRLPLTLRIKSSIVAIKAGNILPDPNDYATACTLIDQLQSTPLALAPYIKRYNNIHESTLGTLGHVVSHPETSSEIKSATINFCEGAARKIDMATPSENLNTLTDLLTLAKIQIQDPTLTQENNIRQVRTIAADAPDIFGQLAQQSLLGPNFPKRYEKTQSALGRLCRLSKALYNSRLSRSLRIQAQRHLRKITKLTQQPIALR